MDGSPGSAETGGAGGAALRGRCAAATRSGDFSVVLEPAVTAVRGQLWDKASSSRVLEEVARVGDCSLVQSKPARCAATCTGTDVCTAEGQCASAPVTRSAGSVRISGLAAPVEMTPLMPGNNYFVAGDFPARGFEPSASIALAAAGADVPAFSLRGWGVDPLVLPEADWTLTPGKAFVVTWKAGSVPDAKIRLSLNVDQHGGTPVNLRCETADDGELGIDASLIDALLDAGVTGFPSGHLDRETIDSVEIGGGCIELAVGAHARRRLSVEGYVPCLKAGDCPEGKLCNTKLQRCE